MKQLAYLEYKFLFDPSEAWSSLFEFEATLSKYLEGLGLEADIVRTISGQPGGRLLIIKKKSMKMPTEPTSTLSAIAPGVKLKAMEKEAGNG